MTATDDLASIHAAWPGYFGDAPNALPAPDTDLAPFLRDIIPGLAEAPWTGRAAVLSDHFRRIEPEFRTRPRIAHLMACVITCLRRDPANAVACALFGRMTAETGPQIASALNSRWLVSVCDTIIDTSNDDTDRALALAGTMFVAALKIAETELRLYRPARPWPPKTRLRHGGEIYDGVQTLWTEGAGDVENLFTRIERGLRVASPAAPFVRELVDRAIEGNTAINRIIGTTGQKRLPIAPAEKIAALKEIMRGL